MYDRQLVMELTDHCFPRLCTATLSQFPAVLRFRNGRFWM